MSIKPLEIENYRVKRAKRTQYDFQNRVDVRRMFDRLMMVAMSVFEWKNLPPSVDEVYLEKVLLTYGSILFFKDEDMVQSHEGEGVYLTLKFMASYQRDVYGYPIVRRAYSDDHMNYRENLTNVDSVIIYDNVIKTIFSDIIYDFAVHLIEIKDVIKQNLEHQRTPYIIGASDEMKAEIESFFSHKRRNKPYFIVKDKFAKDLKEALAVYPTSANFIGDKLQDYYNSVWNEFMVMVGVGTNATPKRERLVASEVHSVNEQSEIFALTRLKTRQRSVKLINKMFNLNIEVDYQLERGIDGTIHNNNSINSKESSKD